MIPEDVVAHGQQACMLKTASATVVGSIRTRRNETHFHFLALVTKQSAALSSVTQHAVPQELSGKWETECLDIRFLGVLCLL